MRNNNKQQNIEAPEVVVTTSKVTILQNNKWLQAMFDNRTRQFVTDFIYSNIILTASTHRFIAVSKNGTKCQILNNHGELVIDKKFNPLIMQIDHVAIFGKDGVCDVYDIDGECVCENLILSGNQIKLLKRYMTESKDKETLSLYTKDKKLMVFMFVLSMAEKSYQIARSRKTCSEQFIANLDNYFDDYKQKMEKICELCGITQQTFAKRYYEITGRKLEEELLLPV